MMIDRIIGENVKKALKGEKKVVIIYGPRQAGKTTLIKSIISEIHSDTAFFTGDDLYTQEIFSKNELESLRKVVGSHRLLIVDEAQRIPNIGLTFKLLIDNLPIMILASGSASFDLADKLSEPLTGRTKTFRLYPLSRRELAETYRSSPPKSALEEMLRYGMYPNVFNLPGNSQKEDYLYELISNYLYKDILMFKGVRKPKKVIDLLALLALQIGNEVAVSELAKNLSLSQKSVENYLDLLEKMFVIINLRGFSRNLRKEIYKSSKYYFMDVGLRNALIRNFNPLNIRPDVGALFENWFILEKIKLAGNLNSPANFYFWRTYDRKEIDLIEEREGKIFAYEIKWKNDGVKPPPEFLEKYKNSEFKVVNQDNYLDFIA